MSDSEIDKTPGEKPEDLDEVKDLSSVFTSNFPDILKQFNMSLIVSTYQAGKLILLRNENGTINTHFRNFNRPMGVAIKPNRLTIGCDNSIESYQNIPSLIDKLDDSTKYDACYVPRLSLATGAIDIHEMAFGEEDQLWFVNTRFSCLSTFDPEFSFCPQWRPHFVTGLGPDDRCHLNGLAMVNGKPKYVTALGETDSPQGWRDNKRDGGVLIDVEANKTIMKGLSMPHSPRWYNNQLWMLESGHGSLVRIDPAANKKITVSKTPGFTRGLDFVGPLAFIGLSQVRETAVFSDFPLLEQLKKRICGVHVVDIRNGETVAFVNFEGDVQEIFAVQALHNTAFPELMEREDELLHACYVIPDEALKDVS